MASENGSRRAAAAAGKQHQSQPLYLQYPANSSWEMSLSTGEIVTGTVYCTDEVSNTVFLQKNLTHTTLATELRVVHVSQITGSKSMPAVEGGDNDGSSTSVPLPKVQKKALEEREKRAIRMAEESFRHINEKVRLMRKKNEKFISWFQFPNNKWMGVHEHFGPMYVQRTFFGCLFLFSHMLLASFLPASSGFAGGSSRVRSIIESM